MKTLGISLVLLLTSQLSFAGGIACVNSDAQDSAFVASFPQGAKRITLTIPDGETNAITAEAPCGRDAQLGNGAIRCEVKSAKGDYTVILARRGGQLIASVAPAQSMQVPTFLSCSEI